MGQYQDGVGDLKGSTQLLEVAREHKRRRLPLDVIVADFLPLAEDGRLPLRRGALAGPRFLDVTNPRGRQWLWETCRRNYAHHYPAEFSRAFAEGQAGDGVDGVVNLVRCAWAGSQRHGALVWSGDIASTWESLRAQITAGIHIGVAGLPWFTTDIGGFSCAHLVGRRWV